MPGFSRADEPTRRGQVTARLSLPQWAAIPHAAKPRLDPRDLTIGVVHLGLGAFHRAHQAVYTQRAMSEVGENTWAICGVTQRSRAVLDDLAPQDGLYTVVERGHADHFQVVAALREVIFAHDHHAALVERIAAASTHVVTLTVTEKGYRHDPVTGRLDVRDAEVQADVAGRPPRSVVGQLVRGLQARYRASGAPMTVVSCDNLNNNGATLRSLVEQFCALLPAAEEPLSSWIAQHVTFPSTVVDRIVPATTAVDRGEVAAYLGLDDEATVVTEPFSQWVIEDCFAAPRPSWEKAGAILTDDVAPYEAMKLRLLNGSHSALAYLGLLASYEHVADFVALDVVATYVKALMDVEVRATLSQPAGFDVNQYQQQLLQRFANPGLQHRLTQIAMDGSLKLPPRLVGTAMDLRIGGHQPRLTALAIAAWMRFVSARVDDAGRQLTVDDPAAARIDAALHGAAEPSTVVDRLLGMPEIFGGLGDDVECRTLLVDALDRLTRFGAVATLRAEVAGLS
jgi:fructuronate reductase